MAIRTKLRYAIYIGLTPPLLHSSTRLVNSGAELSGGSSLCPLQIPGPITASKWRTNQSTYTLRTTLGCAPFFLVLGPVLLQISQRTLEKNSKAIRLTSALRSAACELRSARLLAASCWRLLRFLEPVLLQISQRTIEKIIRRKGYQAICDPRSAIRGLRSALRELRSAICVLRSAVCGPRTANRDPRTAICVFFWLLTKQSAIGIPDSPVFRKML